ncbi:MAG: hypothetical protein RLZZ361_1518 [Cyanobacteriota bacterium]|jgi:hypothetical protein
MVKIQKSCYLVPLLLVFGFLSASAHEMSKSFLQGRWAISSSASPSPARVLFHSGHEHPSVSKKPLAIFNLCTDKENEVYGIVTNNLLDEYQTKLKVESVTQDAHYFDMVLIPYNDKFAGEPLPVKFLHEPEMGEKTISISFDGGLNYYSATKKNSRATPACARHKRQEKKSAT